MGKKIAIEEVKGEAVLRESVRSRVVHDLCEDTCSLSSSCGPHGHLLCSAVTAEGLHGPGGIVKNRRAVRHANLDATLCAFGYGVPLTNRTSCQSVHLQFSDKQRYTATPQSLLEAIGVGCVLPIVGRVGSFRLINTHPKPGSTSTCIPVDDTVRHCSCWGEMNKMYRQVRGSHVANRRGTDGGLSRGRPGARWKGRGVRF